MATAPDRCPTETRDLVVQVVALRRRDAARVALLSGLDQARMSLSHGPHRDARRTLTCVLGAVERGSPADACVDAALRVAAWDLAGPLMAATR
jgi:hypothetical protein